MTDLRALLARTIAHVPADLRDEIETALQKSPRATRLSDDWRPSPSLMTWAMAERPDISVSGQVDAFRDYWNAKAGKDGAKLSWDATFRNWIRNCRAVYKPLPPAPRPQSPQEVARVRRTVDPAPNPRVQALLGELAAKLRINGSTA